MSSDSSKETFHPADGQAEHRGKTRVVDDQPDVLKSAARIPTSTGYQAASQSSENE